MNKLKLKSVAMFALAVTTMGALTTACSSDDNNGTEVVNQDTIDAAVGTYKGKLYTPSYNPGDKNEWYDAVVTVTKEGADKLRVTAKSNEEYSHVTPKTFTVQTGAFFGENTKDIVSLSGSLEGYFHYHGSNKNLSISTEQQSEADIWFNFDGVKQ